MIMISERRQRRYSFRRVRRGLGDDQGSALVEYAVSLTVLMTFIFGIMDFSRFIYTYTFVSESAREATRYAQVRGSTFTGVACTTTHPYACAATAANVTTYVQGLTPSGITPASVTATTTWPGSTPDGTTTPCTSPNPSNYPGCYVKVVVSYPYQFMLPFLPSSATTYTLTSTSMMAISE